MKPTNKGPDPDPTNEEFDWCDSGIHDYYWSNGYKVTSVSLLFSRTNGNKIKCVHCGKTRIFIQGIWRG